MKRHTLSSRIFAHILILTLCVTPTVTLSQENIDSKQINLTILKSMLKDQTYSNEAIFGEGRSAKWAKLFTAAELFNLANNNALDIAQMSFKDIEERLKNELKKKLEEINASADMMARVKDINQWRDLIIELFHKDLALLAEKTKEVDDQLSDSYSAKYISPLLQKSSRAAEESLSRVNDLIANPKLNSDYQKKLNDAIAKAKEDEKKHQKNLDSFGTDLINSSCGDASSYSMEQLQKWAKDDSDISGHLEKVADENCRETLQNVYSDIVTGNEETLQKISAYSSMMQAAIASGNPYVIAAVIVLIAIMELFGDDGDGGGDGDNEGKKEVPNDRPYDPTDAEGQEVGDYIISDSLKITHKDDDSQTITIDWEAVEWSPESRKELSSLKMQGANVIDLSTGFVTFTWTGCVPSIGQIACGKVAISNGGTPTFSYLPDKENEKELPRESLGGDLTLWFENGVFKGIKSPDTKYPIDRQSKAYKDKNIDFNKLWDQTVKVELSYSRYDFICSDSVEVKLTNLSKPSGGVYEEGVSPCVYFQMETGQNGKSTGTVLDVFDNRK